MISLANKKMVAYISTLLLSSGGLVWVHTHSAEMPVSNKGNIAGLVTGSEISRDIRQLENTGRDLRMSINRNRSALINAELVPNQGARIIEIKSRLENDIQDDQRLLDKNRELLRDKETKEQELISKIRDSQV